MLDTLHGIKVQVLAALNSPGLSLAGSGVMALVAQVTAKAESGVSQFTLACAAVTGACIAIFWIQKAIVYTYFSLVRFKRWACDGFPPVKLRRSALSDESPGPGADDVPKE